MQDGTRYRVRQTEDTPLKVEKRGPLVWRYLYFRSAESFANRQPGQDYLTFDHRDGSLVFAVCDGVGQSFFGDLASRLLGDWLTDWLLNQPPRASVTSAQISTGLAEHLRQVTRPATAEVESLPVPFGTPRMVEEVLNDKRKGGSESTFVCVRVDLPTSAVPLGSLIAAWMGDTRLRAWNEVEELTTAVPRDTFRTVERWSSKDGPVLGEPHVLVTPLLSPDGQPVVARLVAYSDGLSVLDSVSETPSDRDLSDMAIRSRTGAASDDISLLELRLHGVAPWRQIDPPRAKPSAPEPVTKPLHKPVEEVVTAPAVTAPVVTAPAGPRRRSPRRRRSPLLDPLTLLALAGAIIVIGYVMAPMLGPQLGASTAPTSTALPAASPKRSAFATLVWQPVTGSAAEPVVSDYEHYWTIIRQALQDLDPSHLADVATGHELELNRRIVQDLAAQKRSFVLDANPVPRVAARGGEALVTETGSVAWHTSSSAPPSASPYGDVPNRKTFMLVLQDDTWKVAFAQ